MTTINRIIRLLPSLVLTMTAAICVSQVSEGPQTASQSHPVSGQVVNSVTGEPIARARVQVGTQQAALTDHDGRFEFDNVSEDSAYAFASKPGYFAEDRGVLAQGQSITLQLIPEAIIFGTITDQNGQPIQDLRVQLTMLQVHNGVRRWQTGAVHQHQRRGPVSLCRAAGGPILAGHGLPHRRLGGGSVLSRVLARQLSSADRRRNPRLPYAGARRSCRSKREPGHGEALSGLWHHPPNGRPGWRVRRDPGRRNPRRTHQPKPQRRLPFEVTQRLLSPQSAVRCGRWPAAEGHARHFCRRGSARRDLDDA